MTDTLRGPLLTAQREISLLDLKRGKVMQKISLNDEAQKKSYVVATNMAETLQNTAKRAGFNSIHAKLKTDLATFDVQIRDYKQVFGMEMYTILVKLEDTEGWLPTVRDIRAIYDQARRDVEKIDARRKEKEKELIKLGGYPMTTSTEGSSTASRDDDDNNDKPKYFKEAAAADAEANAAAAARSGFSLPYQPQTQPQGPTLSLNNHHGALSSSNGRSQDPYMNYGSQITQQPLQQSVSIQPSIDPFASMLTTATHTTQSNVFGTNGQSYGVGPVNDYLGGMGGNSKPNTFSSVPMPSVDPFAINSTASLYNNGAASMMDPFASVVAAAAAANNGPIPVSAPSNNNNNDPFDAFDSLITPQQQQKQQHSQSSNPMFRY